MSSLIRMFKTGAKLGLTWVIAVGTYKVTSEQYKKFGGPGAKYL